MNYMFNMKYIYNVVLVFICFMLLVCCKENNKLINNTHTDNKSVKLDSQLVYVKGFKCYQTFNEYKMKGEGTPVNNPFVYVKRKNNIIYVVISNNKQNVLRYIKIKEYWYNYLELKFPTPNFIAILSSSTSKIPLFCWHINICLKCVSSYI